MPEINHLPTQGRLFPQPESYPQDLENRRGRMLPLGSVLGTVQINHGLGDKAPWPVWSGSTRKPVQFMPMPRRQAVRLWHDARRLERQTRKRGHQDGAIGRNGLAVLHAFLFDFINRATGELTPTRATIARAANICVRSVDRGLEKLKASGEWSYTTGDRVESSPTFANNVIYIGSDDHKVYALNALTGNLRWTYSTGGSVYSSLAYSQSIVYAGSADGSFYALNALTGAVVWSVPTNDGVVRSAAVANGVVYFNSNSTFYAASVANGNLLYSFAALQNYFGGPSVSDGTVYLNTYNGPIYALSANGGTDPSRAPSRPPAPGSLYPNWSLKVGA